MIALFIVPIIVIAFVFYYLGRNQERIEWNKLSEKVKQEIENL